MNNKEIADQLHRLILDALNWLDEQDWRKEMYVNKKDFIISLLERVVIDE